MLHLKKPQLAPEETDRQVRESVGTMLDDIAERGEDAIRDLARKFDGWEGDFVLSESKKSALIDSLPSAVASRISRIEGMEGHARACDWRLRKYFPEKNGASRFMIRQNTDSVRRIGMTIDEENSFLQTLHPAGGHSQRRYRSCGRGVALRPPAPL